MIMADLLELMRCPQTGQSLTIAAPELLVCRGQRADFQIGRERCFK